MEEDGDQPLRSIHNHHSSFVRFINATRREVGVYWIDYQGREVLYQVLSYRSYLDVNTFVTHPWIFVDEETSERYVVNGKEVFFPAPWFAKYRGMRVDLPTTMIERTNVFVTLPLYTLRQLCLREIKKRLQHDDEAFCLEIPRSLQLELAFTSPRKRGPLPNSNLEQPQEASNTS